VLQRDPEGVFRFAALQSVTGQDLLERYGLPRDQLETVVLIRGGRTYTKSDAVLEIAHQLPGVWSRLYALRIVPRPIRNFIYDQIARSRYRLFGKKEQCLVPTPEVRQRFL
jgi:predicted DCC family thiol-disulfide oxidoreductase YuxK